MSVLVYRDRAIAGAAASTLLAAAIIERPGSVLGLDCADELLPVYRAVSRMTADGLLDWSGIRAYTLSETVRADADESVMERMKAALYDRVNILDENCVSPTAEATDWSVVCNDYENDILNAGGIDLMFLTVGKDGSIAHNLGASELAPVTHVERTDTGRVVTVGIATIMAARRVVVLMTAEEKMQIAGRIFNGPITPEVPASYLQLHPNAVFLLDEAAAKQV